MPFSSRSNAIVIVASGKVRFRKRVLVLRR